MTVFTRRDELAFSRVLRELDSRVTFFEEDGRHPLYQEFTARVASLSDSRSDVVDFYVPEPWRAGGWRIPEDMTEAARQAICYFRFFRSPWETPDPTKKWAFDPPLLAYGHLECMFPCDDRIAQNFVMKVLRLLKKVTWNPPPSTRAPDAPPPWPKAGHYGLDACRWSQAGGDVRRALGGGLIVAPSFDIPLNKYYDDAQWRD